MDSTHKKVYKQGLEKMQHIYIIREREMVVASQREAKSKSEQ